MKSFFSFTCALSLALAMAATPAFSEPIPSNESPGDGTWQKATGTSLIVAGSVLGGISLALGALVFEFNGVNDMSTGLLLGGGLALGAGLGIGIPLLHFGKVARRNWHEKHESGATSESERPFSFSVLPTARGARAALNFNF